MKEQELDNIFPSLSLIDALMMSCKLCVWCLSIECECNDYIWFFLFGNLLNVIKNTLKNVTLLVHLSTLCPHIGAPGNGSPSSVDNNIIKNTSTDVAQAEDKSGPSGIYLCFLPLLTSNTSYTFICFLWCTCHPQRVQEVILWP